MRSQRPLAFVLTFSLLASSSLACTDDPGGAADADGDSTTPAYLTSDPDQADLGEVALGQTSAALVILIHNDGDLPSGALTVALGGPDRDAFAIQRSTCRAALAPAASCLVTVAFAPRRAGPATASLDLASDDGDLLAVALTGLGLQRPTLTLTQSTDDLGTAVVGTTGTTVATFTVDNTGAHPTGPLRVLGATADFTLDDRCAGRGLEPGARCAIDLRLSPRGPGSTTLTLSIEATPGGRVSGSVRGIGLSDARLVATPAALAFGTIALDATSRGELVITNAGEAPTGPLSLSLAGAAAAFHLTHTCAGAILPPEGSCVVTVVASPDSVGPLDAALSVSAAPGGALLVPLGARGVATLLELTPRAATFTPTRLGDTHAPIRFELSHHHAHDSGTITVALQGQDAADFTLHADACTGTSLAPGARCAFELAFSPTRRGPSHVTVAITSADAGALVVPIDGLGLAPAALSLSPRITDFGAYAVGYATALRELTLDNLGDEPSGLPAFTLGGADPTAFRLVSHTCLTRLQPGQRCSLFLAFSPTALGPAAASLVAAASPGDEALAALAGHGVNPNQLRLEPPAEPFAELLLGESTERTYLLDNVSEAPTGPLVITRSGPGASDYTLDHDCAALAPGARCTLTVTFRPLAPGPRPATLTLGASPGGTITTPLAGVGVPRLAVTSPEGTPLLHGLDFGDVVVGTTDPPERSVVITNNTPSDAPLAVLALIPSPAQYTFTLGDSCDHLPAGASCTASVRFSPTVAAEHTAELHFSIGAGAHDTARIRLAGRGVHALSLVPGAGTDFAYVSVGTTSTPLPFDVVNAPDAPLSGPLRVTLSGPGFALAADACSGVRLAAGQRCTLSVTFAPLEIGRVSGRLALTATPGGAPDLALDAFGIFPSGVRPTAITLTPSSVPELSPVGTTVGTLAAVDPDPDEVHRFDLISGEHAFSLDGATLRTRLVLDHETHPSLPIRVRVTDAGGQVFEQRLDVTITDVDEPSALRDDSLLVAQGSPPTPLAVLTNDTDPDTLLVVTAVSQPAHGTVTLMSDQRTVTYAPRPGYCNSPPGTALDTFTYTVNSGPSATVQVAVLCAGSSAP